MRPLRAPAVVAGGGILMLLTLVALLAPVLAPHDPRAPVGGPLQLPSGRHLLGTNHIGQDLLSQLVWGARSSLTVALGASALAISVAVLVGVGSALVGGVVETVAMRVVDVFLAVPRLLVIIVVASLVGPSRRNVILVIGLLAWAPGARLLRSQALSLRRRGFVTAAGGFGGGVAYTMRRHLVPALGPLLLALLVAMAGHAVVADAGLAFLGLGDPVGVSWGHTLHWALAEPGLYYNPIWMWWVLPPGFAVMLSVLSFGAIGLGLEPLMNRRAGAVPDQLASRSTSASSAAS